MYKYRFTLDNGLKDTMIGNNLKTILQYYFQLRGKHVLNDIDIVSLDVGPNYSDKVKSIPIDLISKIIAEFRDQHKIDPQQSKCQDMKDTCPEGSNEVDPIMMYEDWCDDIPFEEFVKNDKYLSQCYRLSNLINTFVGGLTAKKGINYMPQWPRDPYSNNALSKDRLLELYNQAVEAKIDIPVLFTKFIQGLSKNLYDVDVAMAGQYIGNSDSINPMYMKKFVSPVLKQLEGSF